jgi:hypothetical protein
MESHECKRDIIFRFEMDLEIFSPWQVNSYPHFQTNAGAVSY